MDNDRSLDQQIEWFHELAALTHDQLFASGAVASNQMALADLHARCLPDEPQLKPTSPKVFANYVRLLRQNEREWNDALCSAISDAEELNTSMGATHAANKLHAFAHSCPWIPFRKVAENQARAY